MYLNKIVSYWTSFVYFCSVYVENENVLIPILVVFPQLLSGRNRRNVRANMPSISVCLVFVMFEYSWRTHLHWSRPYSPVAFRRLLTWSELDPSTAGLWRTSVEEGTNLSMFCSVDVLVVNNNVVEKKNLCFS